MARGDRMGENYDDYLRDDNLHINWYPGHMKKTRDLVRNNLKLVDVVVELLDSRIPFSSRNPDIDNLAGNKPRVVILNKCDLADRAKLDKWIKYYKDRGIKAIPVDTLKGVGLNKLVDECRNAVKDKMDALKEKGRKERPIRIMIVGIPNVGKSSFINRLAGSRLAKVEDRPGVTRGKQWVKLDEGFELLDMPGVLWPKFEDKLVGERLAFTGAVKDDIMDMEYLACRLLEFLKENYPELIEKRYGIRTDDIEPADEETIGCVVGFELLERIGRKRGFLVSGGEINTERAAITVMDEFRNGTLGRLTLEKPKGY